MFHTLIRKIRDGGSIPSPSSTDLEMHLIASSYGITRCPKCNDQIFGEYHNKCGSIGIPHIHCKSRCGYEFGSYPNDYERSRG